MFSNFTWKKNTLLQEMVGGGGGGAHPAPPFPTALLCQSKIMFIFHALRK